MRRKVQLTIFALIFALVLSSCQVDLKRIGDDVKSLGKAVAEKIEDGDKVESTTEATTVESTVEEETTTEVPATEETVAETTVAETTVIETTVAETTVTESVIEETVVEETVTPEITEEVIVTPIERVDFSELTTIELISDVIVENEAFREVYSTEDEHEYAQFEGNRSIVTIEDSPNVANAINLMVDGFYQEAAGKYANVVANAKAQLELNEEAYEDYSSVYVNNEITTNGRILTAHMIYTIETNNELSDKVEEIYSFDLFTGSLITLDDISDNSNELYEALLAEFKEEEGVERFTPIFITPTDDYIPMRLLGENKDGEEVVIMVDLAQYSDYLNRFGKIVCLVP